MAKKKKPAEKKSSTGEKKKNKKKSLIALSLLRKKLRTACGKFDSFKDWKEFVEENLEPILDKYGDDIPEDIQKHIKKAKKLDKATAKGANQACKALNSKLGTAIATLGTGGIFATAAKGIFLAGVVGIGAAVAIFHSTAVSIVITNDGCTSISPPPNLPFDLPGLKLPRDIIYDGGSETAKVPGITAHVVGSGGSVAVTISGISADFNLPAGTVVTFDGEVVGEGSHTFDLRDKETHSLVISCSSGAQTK